MERVADDRWELINEHVVGRRLNSGMMYLGLIQE